MSLFQVEVFCYDHKKQLVAKLDAGQLTPEQIEEGGFNDSEVCRDEVVKLVEEGKGKKIALTIRHIFIRITNITEIEPLLIVNPA